MKNLSKRKWSEGVASVGAWVNLPTLHSAEMLARMGYDWLCFDLQHGLMSYSDLLALIPAISGTTATPFVRVTSNDVGQIGRALDAGAHGVIVPMVNTVEDAKNAVSACRYPPYGQRSCGPMRGAMIEGFDYLTTANEEIACIVMIETQEGLNNVEAIAAVPGVDALFIGPMDLCYGLGISPGSFQDPKFTDAIERILTAAREAECYSGMFGYNAELAKLSLSNGFHFASAGTDISFFSEGALNAMKIASGISGETDENGKKAGY